MRSGLRSDEDDCRKTVSHGARGEHGRGSEFFVLRANLLPEARTEMNLNEMSGKIVDAAYLVHRGLGPGLLESVYEVILADALRARGLAVERQKPITICFEGKTFDEGFRADLIVERQIIVEIKSVEQLARVHKKQLLTYLKLSGLSLGLLINFGGELLKGNIERLVTGEASDLKNPSASSESSERTSLRTP